MQRRENFCFLKSVRAIKSYPALRKKQSVLFLHSPERTGRGGEDNTFSLEQQFEEAICFTAFSGHKFTLALTTCLCRDLKVINIPSTSP